ncbi:hypothetical protein N0V86_004349 [Didymella sp. IMI 355093]|nr:hypothetical protein N0V86_004349 [Didymella sp. IMI 355093]
MKHLQLTPGSGVAPLKDQSSVPAALPEAKETKLHPSNAPSDSTNASLFFVGTATTILEWEGLRILTDPNFLHAGDHVHLGPGVSGTRRTNPAIDIEELPHIDMILLSHYHEDHFDRLVEDKLGADSFTNVHALDFWDSLIVDVKPQSVPVTSSTASLKLTGMPGKHVPPGPLNVANELLGAVPPTNGWMIELGYSSPSSSNADEFASGYRVYITGDTLMVDELKEIPKRYEGLDIDLMLIHLGGTTIPGPSVPLLMVTMDAKQGVELMHLVNPDVTIPIHYDDYDVFLSPLDDFKKEVEKAGLSAKVVYLDRKDQYKFSVKQEGEKKGIKDLPSAS